MILTNREKILLDQAFAGIDSKELTLQQTEKISAQTRIPLREIEWFALDHGFLPLRYQRHIGSLGIEGQMKLLESRVIVVGLGGLGGYVVEELARAGLGQIVGVDPDVFEESNLNRQLLSEEGNLGMKKAEQTSARLTKVNKAVEFTGYSASFEKVPEEIWNHADLVFDCLDNIEDRLILAKRCSTANIVLVHGAIGGWYGEVALVWPGTGMLEKIYQRRGQGIERDLGNPSFTAAVAASLMVAEGVKILIKKDLEKESKVLFFDLLEGEWQYISL
ncbi:MAG: HesA/MoeB/ThiF family protein [Planctomycetota bacterium]